MTHKHHDSGGSTVVNEDGSVERKAFPLNPGDKGYEEAVRRVPVHDSKIKGTLSRVPSYRDLDEQLVKEREASAKRASAPAAAQPPKPVSTGEKK